MTTLTSFSWNKLTTNKPFVILCHRWMCYFDVGVQCGICFNVGVQCGICVAGGCVVSMWEYSEVFVCFDVGVQCGIRVAGGCVILMMTHT